MSNQDTSLSAARGAAQVEQNEASGQFPVDSRMGEHNPSHSHFHRIQKSSCQDSSTLLASILADYCVFMSYCTIFTNIRRAMWKSCRGPTMSGRKWAARTLSSHPY